MYIVHCHLQMLKNSALTEAMYSNKRYLTAKVWLLKRMNTDVSATVKRLQRISLTGRIIVQATTATTKMVTQYPTLQLVVTGQAVLNQILLQCTVVEETLVA